MVKSLGLYSSHTEPTSNFSQKEFFRGGGTQIKEREKMKKNELFFINANAENKFNETKIKLGDQLSVIDESLLLALCNQYARYVALEEKVSVEGETIVSKNGVPYLNPTYTALLSSIKALTSLSKEFGLTIASRKRAGVTLIQATNKKSLFDLVSSFNKEDEELDI